MNVAFILCGALAREVMAISQKFLWDVSFVGISAVEHMQPVRIAPLVEKKIRELMPSHKRMVVVYGDCGTSGELDRVLSHYNVPRIAGPHCYEMYGGKTHDALMDAEPGTFFLTDFLLRGFDGMVWKGLGLDKHPELLPQYFAHYTRLVYLVQREQAGLIQKAHEIANRLHLPLDIRHTGYGELETRLLALMSDIHDDNYQPVLREEIFTYGSIPSSLLARHSRPSARRRQTRARERDAATTISRGD